MAHPPMGILDFGRKLTLISTGLAAFAASLVFGAANEAVLSAQSGGANETIAYTHTTYDETDHPTYDIRSVNADGINVTALTSDGNSHFPSWSPDGRQILFVQDGVTQRVNSNRQSHLPFGLYSVNRDGSNTHMIWGLGAEAIFENRAEWSPDGKTVIAGYRQKSEPHPNIYVINPNGKTDPRLVLRFAVTPSWSPDREKIAFSQDAAIKVMKTDGSGLVTLTEAKSAVFPAWSPNGKQIAFAMPIVMSESSCQIFVMDEDGSNQRQLTKDSDWRCEFPSWSPDGKRIAFSCLSPCPTTASVGYARGSSSDPTMPQCSRRIFVVDKDAPTLKLKPLIDEDAEEPEFAPAN